MLTPTPDTDGVVLPEAARARLLEMTPLGRLARPDDIADVIAFLSGRDARFVSGQVVHVSGGAV